MWAYYRRNESTRYDIKTLGLCKFTRSFACVGLIIVEMNYHIKLETICLYKFVRRASGMYPVELITV